MAVLLVLLVGFSASRAWSQARDLTRTGNKYLQEAKILYDNLQYRDALQRLKQAIRVKGNTRADIVEIYKYLGFIYIIQGHKKHAKRAFELLLKVDPNYEMNPLLTSPKILNFYNRVKEGISEKGKVLMRHTPLKEVDGAERVEVKAYVVDLQKRLSTMVVHYRRRGHPDYSTVKMTPAQATAGAQGSSTFVGYIPFIWTIYDETELFVDYYIAGLDKAGRWVANMGNPKQPMTFRMNLMQGTLPEGIRKTPLLKSWWFWTLVGVGAAGLGTGIYFLADSLNEERPVPTTGTVELIIQ